MNPVPAYEIRPAKHISRGIPVTRDGHIVVGEEGRNREKVIVALPAGAVVIDGQVMEIPVSDPEAVAVILLRDMSGYRGSWSLVYPLPDEVLEAYLEQRNLDVVRGRLEYATPPRLIAKGRCAQGIAGRMGGGEELLFVAREKEAYDILRSGRVYGAPWILRLTVSRGGVTLTEPLADLRSRRAASRW
jgi:hypothetical protein